jgi:O-antigen ligase
MCWFFTVVVANFLWIGLCFYANGEPERGDSFLWGRHFYTLFIIPLYFLFRRYEISDRMLVISLFAGILLSLGDMLVDLFANIDHREQGMNPNAFGPIQLCSAGILFCYVLHNPGKPLRRLAFAGFIMALVNIVLSLSRTTWVATAVLIILTAAYLARHLASWKKTAIIAGLALVLASSYLLPMVKNRVDYAVNSITAYLSTDDYRDASRLTSSGHRFELWKAGWNVFRENPILGAGVGGYSETVRKNYLRYGVNEVVLESKYVHNQYLATLATRGLPGLLLFLLVMGSPLYIAISDKPETAEAKTARLSLVLIVLTYLIGCLAEDHFEGKSAIMFTGIMFPLLLARLDPRKAGPGKETPP